MALDAIDMEWAELQRENSADGFYDTNRTVSSVVCLPYELCRGIAERGQREYRRHALYKELVVLAVGLAALVAAVFAITNI